MEEQQSLDREGTLKTFPAPTKPRLLWGPVKEELEMKD